MWTIAGLPTGTVNDEKLLEHTVKGIQSVKLDSMPGTVHNYATINYDVLALIIENVSGMSYEEYIEKNVLEPLGMSNSYFRVDDTKVEQLAQGYRYAFLGVRKYGAPTFYGNIAAGYLVSNTEDLSIWLKAQMGMLDTDMAEKINRAIIESHSYPIEKGSHYFANFSSQVIIGRTNNKAVFALANIFGAAPTKAAEGIFQMMQGETVEIYIMVLWFEKRGLKKYTGIKVSFCLLMVAIVLVFPYILHYSYFAMTVWCTPCLLIAIAGSEICLAEYVILYIYSRKKETYGGKYHGI